MLLAQVREAARREPRPVDAVLGERVRRHLDGDCARPGVAHVREQRLEVISLGGRALDGERCAVDAGAHGPDDAGAPPRGAGDGLEQVRDGRLAIRAGYSDTANLAGRMPVEPVGSRPERGADARDAGLCHRYLELAFDEESARAGRDRIGCVQVPVGDGTGNAREAAAARSAAAVVRDGIDVDAPVPHPPQNVDSAEELVQAHAPSSPFVHGAGVRVSADARDPLTVAPSRARRWAPPGPPGSLA
jgi:hypothetical protein